MKKLIYLIFLLACLKCSATSIYFNLADFSMNPITNRNVQVQAFSVPTATQGSVIVGGQLSYVTDSNGTFTITNASLGFLYQVRVLPPPNGGQQTIFQIYAPQNISTNSTYNGYLLLVANSTSTFAAGSVAWSAAISDLRYISVSNSVANGLVPITTNGTYFWAAPPSAPFQNIIAGTGLLGTTNGVNVTITTNGGAGGGGTIQNIIGTGSVSGTTNGANVTLNGNGVVNIFAGTGLTGTTNGTGVTLVATGSGASSNITGTSPIIVTPGGGNAVASLKTDNTQFVTNGTSLSLKSTVIVTNINAQGTINAASTIAGATTITAQSDIQSGGFFIDTQFTGNGNLVSYFDNIGVLHEGADFSMLSGVAATNQLPPSLAALAASNGITLSNIIWLDPTRPPFNATADGTTDDTVAITNCLWYGGLTGHPVLLPSKTFKVSPFIMYTNQMLFGLNGSKLLFSSSSSGNAIVAAQLSTNIHISGIEIDGGKANSAPASDDGRTGLLVFSTQNPNCSYDTIFVHGFGKGIQVFDAGANGDPQIHVSKIVARYCWIGLQTDTGAEYISYTDITCMENHFGLMELSGNNHFASCSFDRNKVNLAMNTGQNPGHIEFSSCSFNHAGTLAVAASNVLLGAVFGQCSFLPPAMYITNCQGFSFNNCFIGWNVTNAATLYFNSSTNCYILDPINPYTITNSYAINNATNCLDVGFRYANALFTDTYGNSRMQGNVSMSSLTVTNGITNALLTASKVVGTDANKALQSVDIVATGTISGVTNATTIVLTGSGGGSSFSGDPNFFATNGSTVIPQNPLKATNATLGATTTTSTLTNTGAMSTAGNFYGAGSNTLVGANITAPVSLPSLTASKLIGLDANKAIQNVDIVFTGTDTAVTNANTIVVTGSASGFWATNGNAGISTSSFLGTTDSKNMNIKAYNSSAILINPVNTSPPNITLGGELGNNFGLNNIIVPTGSIFGNSILGGQLNTIGSSGSFMIYSSICGGQGNNITNSQSSSILGGLNNSISANYSAILGGNGNSVSGQTSIAAGASATSSHDNSFVWSDSASFGDTATKQFLIHSANGVGINTNNPGTNALSIYGGTSISGSASVVGMVSITNSDNTQGTPLLIAGSTNSTYQSVLWNTNNGSSASADFIVVNDLGTPSSTSNFVDFGINSSGYNANDIGIMGDGYIYSAPGVTNFYVVAEQTNGHVRIAAGGGTTNFTVVDIGSNSMTVQKPTQFNGTNNIFSGQLIVTNSVSTTSSNQVTINPNSTNVINIPMNLGVNSTSNALTLTNVNIAASGLQQFSPALHFGGQGWKTTATAASQPVDALIYLKPVQGAANPTATLNFDIGVNNASAITAMSVTSAGTFTSAAGIVSGANVTSAAASSFVVSGRSAMSSPADGTVAFKNNAGTAVAGILGTTAANDPAAGNLGETVTSAIAIGAASGLTTATASNVTSISLTAGDWDVEGNVNFSETTATGTGSVAGISTTTGTLPTDGTEVYSGVQLASVSTTDGITLPRKRVNVSSTTTVYLVGKSTFSLGNVAVFGSITARRIR